MASKLGFTFLSLTLLLLLSSCSADQAFIDSLCGESIHRDVCESMLTGNGASQHCTDKPCMAGSSAGVAIRNASNTHIYIQSLIQKGPPASLIPAMNTCSEIYADAIAYLNRAIGFIQSSSFQEADNTINIVVNIATRCEAAFSQHPSPLAPWNDMFSKVADVCWELVDMCIV